MTYDAIVIGCGGVGSAALSHLAGRGARVLGIDRFAPGHDRGSSHGETRIIRQAYFEHPDYVPLLMRSHELWSELEESASGTLYHQTGLLQVGPPDGELLPGCLESADQHDLAVETLTGEEVSSRFPGFAVGDGLAAVFEERAGYLLVEQSILTHLEVAQRQGAELRNDETVTGWQSTGDIVVETDRGRYRTHQLVVTVGAWTARLLGDLGVELQVLRKYQHWFANDDPRYRADNGSPVFIHELPTGWFYGFPQIDELGVKVGEHTGGALVPDPSQLDRSLDTDDQDRAREFLATSLPGVTGAATRYSVCLYTMSPDEHFIVDRHPGEKNVWFAAGLSGHGFKFTPVLGEVLADLALDGKTELPYQFLRLDRLTGG